MLRPGAVVADAGRSNVLSFRNVVRDRRFGVRARTPPGIREPRGRGVALVSTGNPMGFDQYHEPAHELPEEGRTFARMIASLTEEAEAIGWYEQRLALERDREAADVMANAQAEEFKHFAMNLEFLLRRKPVWREITEGILFRKGSIVDRGDEAEEEAT